MHFPRFLSFLLPFSPSLQPPPSTVLELEEYMRSVVGKEINRDDIEFGSELGSGEFGAVFEGGWGRC